MNVQFISCRDFHLMNLFFPNICMLFLILFPFIFLFCKVYNLISKIQ